MIYRYMNCSTDGYFARGRHSREVRILARGAFSRVVRIGAWCVFSPMVRILARGTYLRVVRLAAAFEDPQQLISVRFGKWDNFPDRFGSDMQKYRFNIGRFGLFFGTDYIGSYCLEGPIHFGIGIGPGARTGTNRPNAISDGDLIVSLPIHAILCSPCQP